MESTGPVQQEILPEFVAERASVCALQGPDRRKYDAQATDFSQRSLVLVLDNSLPVGVWTKIELERGIVFGEVSRSEPAPCAAAAAAILPECR